jgi:hypothetical protein
MDSRQTHVSITPSILSKIAKQTLTTNNTIGDAYMNNNSAMSYEGSRDNH